MVCQDRVALKFFLGKTKAPKKTKAFENYWNLIGLLGVVISVDPPIGINHTRILVRFDNDIKLLGLECHNPIENSLWIERSDLIAVK